MDLEPQNETRIVSKTHLEIREKNRINGLLVQLLLPADPTLVRVERPRALQGGTGGRKIATRPALRDSLGKPTRGAQAVLRA